MADDENTTKSTRTRWEHTGSIAALLLVTTSCATVILYAGQGRPVPLWAATTFGLTVLASAAWTFGESALRAATDAKGGK